MHMYHLHVQRDFASAGEFYHRRRRKVSTGRASVALGNNLFLLVLACFFCICRAHDEGNTVPVIDITFKFTLKTLLRLLCQRHCGYKQSRIYTVPVPYH
jgi:hypothetical protein